ncbi:MAG: sialate O-acetylesterase [Verrucomicrobiota bacterium]
MRALVLIVVAIGLGSPFGVSALEVAPMFTNGMILQRELPVPVWGSAKAGDKIVVSFGGQEVTTKAGQGGDWMVKLAPMKASVEGRTMTVRGRETVVFDDVLVGEVWLCSGQSNMGGTLKEAHWPLVEEDREEIDFKAFRYSNAKRDGWVPIDEENYSLLSTVSYFFGIKLYRELNKEGIEVPVGLVPRAMSGSTIQSWMPKTVAEGMRRALKIEWNPVKDQAHHQPGVMFEERLEPVIPYAVRGAIWYQGESNSNLHAWHYQDMLPELIETWRELWAEEADEPLREFPFYFVQVPPQSRNSHYSRIRDSMRRVLDRAENTGMAVFYDYGPAVHPPNKEPAGERLALWALAKEYGFDELAYSGPLLRSVAIEDGRAVLEFDHVGGGLKGKDGGKRLKFFELAGEDGEYVAAKAWIEGERVIVESDAVPAPVHVRYLFNRIDTPKEEYSPEMSLYNEAGLPASPFITDDVIPEPIDKVVRREEEAKARKAEKAEKAKEADEERRVKRRR